MADGVYEIKDDDKDPRNFSMTPREGVEVPEDQQALQIEIQRILNALDLIYPRSERELEDRFMAARDELMGWANVGLAAKPAQPALVTRALPIFKEDILLREAGRVKNTYMRRLGAKAILFAFLALIVASIAMNIDYNAGVYQEAQQQMKQAFLVRAEKLRTEANQGNDATKALGSKVNALIEAVNSVDKGVQAVVTTAKDIEVTARNPAEEIQKFRPEAQEISNTAQALAKAARPGGTGNTWAGPLACFALLWIGCMVGVWLSFGYRKTIFQFDDLIVLETDRMEPSVRLVFAGVMTLLIGLFFYKKVITIVVGDVSTAQIGDDPLVALILGMVCGFSELVLGTKVAQRAATFLEWK